MNQEYVNKLHNELIPILSEVKRICDAYGIRYYLVGGTLLGAVRHQGFIPWDDDIDIAMPRKDFERFIKTAQDQLSDPYKLDWIDNNPQYMQVFARVRNSRTVFEVRTRGESKYTGSMSVDIFPLDTADDSFVLRAVRQKAVSVLIRLMYEKNLQYSNVKARWIVPFSMRFLQRMCRLLMISSKAGGENYIVYPYPKRKRLFKKEFFAEGKMLLFENRDFNCPNRFEEVLKCYFGEDYCTPKEQNELTHKPVRLVFSDGVEIVI